MSGAADMPAADVHVDAPLARRLLERQHPDLAALDIRLVANGWDNVVLRLGDDLALRLPRREVAAVLVEHEQRWLPELAPRLPLAAPAPVRVGTPDLGYPWHWSVCPWLPGRTAAEEAPEPPDAAAETLGAFCAALHQPAPAAAPANPVRGIPLAGRAEITERFLAALHGLVDTRRAAGAWREVVGVPAWSGPPLWLHGDLHPANLLVRSGRLSAVIDFGDLTAGDPATDLAVAWMLFPADARCRSRFRAAAGEVDDDTWARARGWALSLSIAFLANSADNPLISGIGRATLAAVLDGD